MRKLVLKRKSMMHSFKKRRKRKKPRSAQNKPKSKKPWKRHVSLIKSKC